MAVGDVRKRDLGLLGAVAGAFAASACCVGPLILSLAGVSSSALLVAFVPWRPWFIGVSVVALAAGFWLTYRRPLAQARNTNLADGPACACELPRASAAGRVSVWIAAVLVALLVAAPSLFSRESAVERLDAARARAMGLELVSIPVEGMTCSTCERVVERVLTHTPGVIEASVDAEAGRATVLVRPGAITPGQLAERIARVGYVPGAPESLTASAAGRKSE